MNLSTVVVCSFYTNDSYYRGHADTLRRGLDRLGVQHELQEIEKAPGEEWPDICRKKIPFLAGVCERNPDKKVYWIDVDCQLLEFPDFIVDFSADMAGFQRGFGSPLNIGYAVRTRFWEPCFFGINTTVGARKFIADAKELEAASGIRATDDYFFEESWRSNAHRLSFQVIPSICVESKADDPVEGVPTFFSFGASGNVAEFKDKVVQHGRIGRGLAAPSASLLDKARSFALRCAKAVERRLPKAAAQRMRKLADKGGVTQKLTGGADTSSGPTAAGLQGSPHRRQIVNQMTMAAQRGDRDAVNHAFVRLSTSGIPTAAESLAKQTSDSFLAFAGSKEGTPQIPVAWWPRPFPGNFGDWLSPLIISEVSGHPVTYISPTAKSSIPHLVAVGSIGRFIKPKSIVVGTGVSSTEIMLDKNANYVSLRGPITADLLVKSGGPRVESFGDPGILISRVMPMDGGETNGRLALVRHFTHAKIRLSLPSDMDEIDVLMSHPDAIQGFVTQLHQYDGVITSAMHVMIACHSYGIPCLLVSFKGFETAVHGTGIKYRDYALGAGLDVVHEPKPISTDLRVGGLRNLLTETRINEAKVDEVEAAVRTASGLCLDALISNA